jgi:hypothetical protein
MRTNKELLELMLENQQYFEDGLCGWIFTIRLWDRITTEEYYELKKYLSQNKPITFHRIFSAFWWKRGDIKPRIKWIKRHIKKLS